MQISYIGYPNDPAKHTVFIFPENLKIDIIRLEEKIMIHIVKIAVKISSTGNYIL